MPKEIYLVKVGMNMTEGVVEEWYVADGATVTAGEMLYRLETEKVNLDVEAESSGVVKHIVAEGVTQAPGAVVGYIFAKGEAIPDNIAAGRAAPDGGTAGARPREDAAPAPGGDAGSRVRASPAARRLAVELNVDYRTLDGSGPGGRVVEADVRAAADAAPAETARSPSSPIARKLARELGVDLASVSGTGPGGRITREDVEAVAAQGRAAVTGDSVVREATGADSTVPVRGMRRTIAARMHQSLQTMAQLTMDMDVVMDDAIKLRGQLLEEWRDENLRPTYTDLVVAAAAKALRKHPAMNAVFGDDVITLRGDVNVGIAVALEDGLIVPVVHGADGLPFKALVARSSQLAEAARSGTLSIDNLADGTFTVSALGMYGVDAFTPIINAPQAGILGVNRIRDDVVWHDDSPARVRMMRLSLTWDHRVLDGAPAARFLGNVRDLLEQPFRLLV